MSAIQCPMCKEFWADKTQLLYHSEGHDRFAMLDLVLGVQDEITQLKQALKRMTAYAEAYKGRFPDNVRKKDLDFARNALLL